MLILALVKRLVKILKSASSPFQIAGGFTLGMFLGMVSFNTLFAAPVILLVIVLNVNIAGALLGLLLFRLFAFLLDPAIHSLGFWLLTRPALHGLWSSLYRMEIVPYTRFNNTVVLGGLIAALVLVFPVYRAAAHLITAYRENYEEYVKKYRVLRILRNSRLIKWWNRVGSLRG
jgi:uncharacterized protein (TIGR03546 family)